MNKNIFCVAAMLLVTTFSLRAQENKVKLVKDKTNPAVHVTINGKHFTDFFFLIPLQSLYSIPSRHPMEPLSPEGFR